VAATALALLENYSGSHGAPLSFFFFLLLSWWWWWWWWWWWLLFLLLLFGAPWRMAKQEKLIEKIYILSLSLSFLLGLCLSAAGLRQGQFAPLAPRQTRSLPRSLPPSSILFHHPLVLLATNQPTTDFVHIVVDGNKHFFTAGLFLWAPNSRRS
jgi:hypothetical protein